MASRAHVIHHFSLDDPRPRRHVRYGSDDPVVLPLSRSWGMNGAVLVLALVTAGVAAASAYSVFRSQPAATAVLAETPVLPLERDLASDAELTRAHVIQGLNGPAFAVRSIAAPGSEEVSQPETAIPSVSTPRHDYIVDDTAPDVQPKSSEPPPVEAPFPERMTPPYPNPSTTPPEGIAPPETAPETPTPALDPENPYR